MTTLTYLYCFLSALLGLVFYLTTVKVPSIKERYKVANEKFTLGQYLQDDATALISSLAAILLWLIVMPEAIAFRPSLVPWIITVSACVGFMGTTLLTSLFGLAQKKLNAIVDEKTDIADGMK